MHPPFTFYSPDVQPAPIRKTHLWCFSAASQLFLLIFSALPQTGGLLPNLCEHDLSSALGLAELVVIGFPA